MNPADKKPKAAVTQMKVTKKSKAGSTTIRTDKKGRVSIKTKGADAMALFRALGGKIP